MVRNTRIKQNPHEILFLFFSCLLISVPTLLFNTTQTASAISEEERDFMKKLGVHEKKQKKVLQTQATVPLDDVKQRLLNQLLATEGPLGEVLSTPEYLLLLNLEIDDDWMISTHDEAELQQLLVGLKSKTLEGNYPTIIAEMPTPKQGKKALLSFKNFLPPKLTDEQKQMWITFYFKIRKIYATESNILANKSPSPLIIQAIADFGFQYFPEEPKTAAEKKAVLREVDRIFILSRAPRLMAEIETTVYHDAWQQQVEKYGSREGLLRCAITTPAEFALTHSFFENTDDFEKWISQPLPTAEKTPERKQKVEKQTDEKTAN